MKVLHELVSPESTVELKKERVDNSKISSLLYNFLEEILYTNTRHMTESGWKVLL